MRQTLSHLRQELGLHSVSLSLALLALTGCGGSDDSTTASTSGSDTSSSAPANDAAESMPAPGGAMHGSGPGAPEGMSGAPGGAMSGGSMAGMHGGGDSGHSAASGDSAATGDAAATGMHGAPGGGMMSGMMPGMGQNSGGQYGAMPGAANAPPKSTRPTDFAKWTDEDFHAAVRERDEAVLKAIDARTKAKPADPAVATLLTALLVTSAEIPAGPPQQTMGQPGGSGMMQMPGMGSGMPGAPGMQAPGSLGGGMHGSPPGAPMRGDGAAGGAGVGILPGAAELKPQHRSRMAVDSIELMLLEAATAYQAAGGGMQKGPASSRLQKGGGPQSGTGAGMHGAGAGMHGSDGQMSGGERRDGENPAGTSPGMPGAPGTGMGGAGPQEVGNLDSRVLTQNIIGNLVKNGSPVAWQTIFAIAAGTMPTAVTAPEGTQIVAESLLKNIQSGGAQVEQVLLAILEGKAQLPPESRAVFLATMTTVSSAAADKMTGFDKVASLPTTPAGGFGMSSGMGGPQMPGAGPGFGGLGLGGPGDSAASGMAGFSSGGASGASSPATANVTGLSDAEITRAAAFLWGPKCVASVAEQLKSTADLATAGDLLKLAASIPNQKTREATYSALAKVHSLGADTLRSAGLFSELHDPGLLVVLKTLPRQKPAKNEAQTLDSWSMTSEDLVLALRDRMKALSTQPGKLAAVSDAFPVKLHRNAVSEFSGVMTLPGAAGTNMKDSAPSETKVYYARTSFTPQKPKDQEDIKEHYESRVSGYARPNQAKQLLWIDGVKGGTTGVRRTMDVIIQAKSGAAGQGFGGSGGAGEFAGVQGGGGGQNGSFSIEIIVVETADPKGSSTAAANSTPGKN